MPAAVAYAAPKLVSRRPPSVPQIPANIAFREITRFVFDGLQANGLQWGVDAIAVGVWAFLTLIGIERTLWKTNELLQELVNESRKGRIGPWEREK